MAAFYTRILAIMALVTIAISGPSPLDVAPTLQPYRMNIDAGETHPTVFLNPAPASVHDFAPILLGTTSYFAILTAAGVSTVPNSVVNGNMGSSPIAATGITGFALTMDRSNMFSKSTQVTGNVYAANYASPTPTMMTTAIGHMGTAYTDAMSRTLLDGNNLNIKSGLIAGTIFTQGKYRWVSDITISDDIYFKGDERTKFLMQSTGNVVMSPGVKMLFIADKPGGKTPSAANIIWVAAGYLDVGTTAHAEGVFLIKTHAVLKTGSSLEGHVLAQTACTLDTATITSPAYVYETYFTPPDVNAPEDVNATLTGLPEGVTETPTASQP
jgi:hypothetical protein